MARRDIEDTYPLSPLQEGMLFHSLHPSELSVYVEQMSVVLEGPLDAETFRAAWQEVVDRHAILRTAFAWKNLERPLQVVGRRAGVPFEQQDWRELPTAEQSARLEAHLDAERRRGFSLSKAPLMRLSLFRTAAETHCFVWSFHHLLLDGWSIALVLEEVLDGYRALRRGDDLRLERPRPYRDHIDWLERQDLGSAERFWRRTLRGITAPTLLPIVARPPRRSPDGRSTWHGRAGTSVTSGAIRRSDVPSARFADEQVDLPAAITERLRALARRQRLTLSTLLQGAWALLLSRLCGEEEVVFGTTVSGRPTELAGVEAMVGLFINTLPVRARVPREASLLPWLHELQGHQVEREQYAYSPLVDIQRWSEVPRGVPLIESLVVFENFPIDPSIAEAREGVRIAEVRGVELSKYPITIAASAHGEGMTLKLLYDAACFDAPAIRRLVGSLETVLSAMPERSESRLGDLPILTERQRHEVLVGWNATATPRDDRCVHERFEAQAERTPEAPAVVAGCASLTYGALNARANRLAHHLRGLGVGPEVLVAIGAERSLDLYVAVLAVLKAGGAYVPLDPSHPAERLAFVARDCRLQVLLTQAHLRDKLPPHTTTVCLDEDAAWAGESEANPSRVVSRDSLAYVIYTSGSTGRPKGVAVTHGNVANHNVAQAKRFGLSSADRVLQFASIGFDAAVEEIFPTWTSGAALVVRPAGPPMAGAAFVHWVRERGITVLNLPTAYWHEWTRDCAAAGATMPACLRLVVVGGEEASAERFAEWRTLLPHGDGNDNDITWMNTYGPTETTVVATSHVRSADDDRPEIPIGRPLANTQAYVLDAHGEPAAVGAPGELYVGGAGVARGYVARPGLTAELFVPHPFASGERLYRTGDRARWNDRGEIEFLGRTDRQVKLRGHRIEPGEIEAALRAHPRVSDAVVVVREDRLVAYVVADGEVPGSAELRAYLGERLPEPMVPSAVTALSALPLTPNGKVDRCALPESQPEVVGYEAPRTELEAALARVWAEVLRVPRVGVHDNFFELGGHSLTSIRLSQRIGAEVGRELPLQVLLSRPTVHAVARWLTERAAASGYRIPLRTVQGAEHMIAFMPTILGTGVHYSKLAQKLTSPCAMATCRLPGTMQGEDALTSIEAIAAHCKEHLVVHGEHRVWSLVGWSFGGVVAYELARQLAAEGIEVRRVVLVDAFVPASQHDEVTDPHDSTLSDEAATRMARANAAALRAYAPRACALPVADIRATETLHALEDGTFAGRPIASWSGARSIVSVPGGHDSIFSPDHIDDLARALNTALT
jgi:amino acid adenylation domain-containing protein